MPTTVTLQFVYYLVAILVGLVATGINIALFVRNKPDRVKNSITDAVRPLVERMGEFESVQEQHGRQLTDQDKTLSEIRAEIAHGPSRSDLNALHGRITELIRSSADTAAVARALQEQQRQLNQFLLENGRG